MNLRKNRAFAFVMVSIAYLLAIFAGVVCYHYLPFAFWLNLLIADILATVVVFIFSVAFKNASFYDPYWSVQPPVIIIAFSIGNEFRLSQLKKIGKQATIVGIFQAVVTTLIVDAALIVLHLIMPDKLPLEAAIVLGAIATATADTLASEIGVLDPNPRLITTFQKVDPGTNGAVSTLGTAVGIFGAAIIGIASYFLGIMSNPLIAITVAIISGTVGCFMDSILGALFENRGLITNEHVNLFATIVGALVGIVLL